MKFLLITEIFPPKIGGSGRWFWEIYSRLAADTYIVAAGCDPLANEHDAMQNLNCLRWPLTFNSWGIASVPSVKSYCKLFNLLRDAVKSRNIESIHCGRALPEGLLGWMSWKWFGIPYLCYVHGEELPTYHSSREYKFLSQLVYSNAHRVIVNSENTRKSFLAHTGIAHSVRVMHPGVDIDFFRHQEPNGDMRRQLQWHDKKVILTVGRLQKRKGHDHLILALNFIREHIPDVLYVIVGEGEEQDSLEKLVTSESLQEHVLFAGKVDDATMLACYQHCDLFVLANREVDGDFEGFGMVLLEAQACGKPVIAGKSGGTSETMIPGETGLLVDADKPEDIADAIVQLLGDRERLREMGERAQEWVRENFDWRVLTVQAENIFSELNQR